MNMKSETLRRLVGALVGFLISLVPASFGLTEFLTEDVQVSLTGLLIVAGYALMHKGVLTSSDEKN